MPFIEQRGRIPLFLQQFTDGGPVLTQRLPGTGLGMGDSAFKFVHTRLQAGPGGRAAGCHMKILEPDTFLTDLIHMGCFDKRMPVPAQVSIALVIRENEKNVRGPGHCCGHSCQTHQTYKY